MRKLQEKIAELQQAHSEQIEAVLGQYSFLLQQVRKRGGCGVMCVCVLCLGCRRVDGRQVQMNANTGQSEPAA